MALTVRRFEDAGEFAEAAMLFLLDHEVEHNLLIGITGQAIDDPNRWPGRPLFITIDQSGVPVAVALRTPPYLPILSRIDDPAAIPILVDLFLAEPEVTGVKGPTDVAAEFADLWSGRTGQTIAISTPERIYQVEQVIPVTGVPGLIRRATVDDRVLLIEWNRLFIEEAFGERATEGHLGRSVDSRLRDAQGGFAVWENGEPVSLAGFTGPTPNGIRIGPVFTPEPYRGRGYAGALTAALSQQLLDEGRRFCALYTDLANPISNRLYQRIGYEPVADSAEYRFT